MTVKTV